MQIREARYDDDDATALIDEVQRYYVSIYGGPDSSPVDPAEFERPRGAFFLGYEDFAPVAMGGWRLSTHAVLGRRSAEIKRMYVVRAARGRGHARALLTHLEQTAARTGADAMVLETGRRQVDAIGLYRSAGYVEIARFGHYADQPGAIHLGKLLAAAR